MSLQDTVRTAMDRGAQLAQLAWGETLQLKSAAGVVEEFPGRISNLRSEGSQDAGGLMMDLDARARWRMADGREPLLGESLRVKGGKRVLQVAVVESGNNREWIVGLKGL